MAENAKLSFTEKIARARAEAASKTSSPENAPASAQTPTQILARAAQQNVLNSDKQKFYFNCSAETTRVLLPNGKKISFVNHFYITDDPADAAFVRQQYCNKGSGHIKFTEVSEMFYQSSTMIQPEILPLPVEEPESPTLAQQEQRLDAS